MTVVDDPVESDYRVIPSSSRHLRKRLARVSNQVWAGNMNRTTLPDPKTLEPWMKLGNAMDRRSGHQ